MGGDGGGGPASGGDAGGATPAGPSTNLWRRLIHSLPPALPHLGQEFWCDRAPVDDGQHGQLRVEAGRPQLGVVSEVHQRNCALRQRLVVPEVDPAEPTGRPHKLGTREPPLVRRPHKLGVAVALEAVGCQQVVLLAAIRPLQRDAAAHQQLLAVAGAVLAYSPAAC
eukprot:7385259-Prymnesium_polylepis.1